MAKEKEEKQQDKKDKKKKEKKGKKEKKEEKKKPEKQKEGKSEGDEKKSFIDRFMPGIIIGLVVVSFAGVGFTAGRLFGSPQTPGTSENSQTQGSKAKDSEGDTKNSWYYHMAPVIANLNVSDVTRYVKASLTLEVSDEMDEKKFSAFLDGKQPILTNWLTVYLASLGLDDIRGDNNLKRIQAHVLDAFNEKLFPDSKPLIKHILFKEFAVQ